MWATIQGDCLDPKIWQLIPRKSVHCCVTSPPYFGLRDYGIEGQIGLEPTVEEFVSKMVQVFRQVHRVLRDDGTLWVNLGDSYAHNGSCGGGSPDGPRQSRMTDKIKQQKMSYKIPKGLKPKDLIGIPWRVAFALQQDGWYLRQDIIWHKPSPMPESCTDRCTKSHEYVFLLTKSPKYFYDADAIREPANWSAGTPCGWDTGKGGHGSYHRNGRGKSENIGANGESRNKRSVWTVASQPYPSAHFATFPPKLIEPMILAGTSQKGCCSKCGEPYYPIIEKQQIRRNRPNNYVKRTGEKGSGNSCSNSVAGIKSKILEWKILCGCNAEITRCTVLDPFAGSGTTLQVAAEHNRQSIGIELNPEYINLISRRLEQVTPYALFT